MNEGVECTNNISAIVFVFLFVLGNKYIFLKMLEMTCGKSRKQKRNLNMYGPPNLNLFLRG